MGQAKRRGTFEERKAEALARPKGKFKVEGDLPVTWNKSAAELATILTLGESLQAIYPIGKIPPKGRYKR